jgi:anti-sigma regulatory factor (Ser/Thr protein kinase)
VSPSGAPSARLLLAPEPASVPRARRKVRELLAAERCGADEDTALLLVSEVVTNAVLHARTDVHVDLWCVGERLRVEVRDGSAAMPALHFYSAEAATGRGLRLLDRLADRWGAERDDTPDAHSKTVWLVVAPSGDDGAAFGPGWLTPQDQR